MVLPFFILRKKHHLITISDTVSVHSTGNVVNVGVFGAAITQIFFVYYLYTRLDLYFPLPGVLFFVPASISFALASYYTVVRSPRIHNRLVKMYFTSMAIGASLLSLSFLKISVFVATMCFLDIFIMYVGAGFYYRKGRLGEAEIWTIFFSTL
jgi:hypothetical protein